LTRWSPVCPDTVGNEGFIPSLEHVLRNTLVNGHCEGHMMLTGMKRYGTRFSYSVHASPYLLRQRWISRRARCEIMQAKNKG